MKTTSQMLVTFDNSECGCNMKKQVFYDIKKLVNGWYETIDRCSETDMEKFKLVNKLKYVEAIVNGIEYVDEAGGKYMITKDVYEIGR
jgi:hypothetical protein